MEFLLVAIPFLAAAALIAAGDRIPVRRAHPLAACVMAALFVWCALLVPAVRDAAIVRSLPWVPSLGLSVDLYLDGLSLLFVLLITGIGAAVFWYAAGYQAGDPRARRFCALLLGFAGSMLGLVLAGNLLALFVCWEATSVFSFLLIGFDGDNPRARRAATQALLVTGGGGLALLAGLVLLGEAGGTYAIPELLDAPIREHPWYGAITLLVLAGCFTKSAQVPFHFWLPGSMTAPTPASAYLHSATMVKAGVYLLARLSPTLGDTALWTTVLPVVGAVTMLWGAAVAVRRDDLKEILAYATVSWLGALVLLLGLPGQEGVVAALVGVVAHALYKSPLFMVAGAVDHATGTRSLRLLGGLARRAPLAAGVTVLSALSMAGVIPLLGFVAKETLLESLLHGDSPLAPALLVPVVTAAALTVVAAAVLVWEVFLRPEPPLTVPRGGATTVQEETGQAARLRFHPLPRTMLWGPAMIAALSLLGALSIEAVVGPLIALATPVEASVHLFNGFNDVFALSLAVIAAGVLVFGARDRWRGWRGAPVVAGEDLYDAWRRALDRAGDVVLRLQDGKLSHYLAVLLGVVGVLLAVPAYSYLRGANIAVTIRGGTDVMMAAFLLLAMGATLASILFRGHLLAALAMSVAGYAVAGVFLLEPAPDVAMVQVVVETLGAVLIVVMLSRISERKRRRAAAMLWGRGRATLRRDLAISILVGVGVGVFALTAVANRPDRPDRLPQWYLDNAGRVGVRDVVSGIITDFRGTDTLVEITVFAMAALGTLTVLYTQRGARPADEPPPQPVASLIETPLTRYAATLLLPVAGVIALAHLLYAGDGPGDGFTAGVIGGISVALWYQVFGYGQRQVPKQRGVLLIGGGLVLAYGNALLPLLWGGSFLEHTEIPVPLPAGLHLSSATLFELAIALTVFGSVITMLNAITNPEGIEQL